jgi:hypothetical protein
MMTPLYDIVLVVVMAVPNPFGPTQFEYKEIDYYNSWSRCRQEQRRLSQHQDKRTAYLCLKTDRN